MKKIIIILVFLANMANAQTHCSDNINTVTTDWRSPLSLNQWDWTALTYDLYIKNRIPVWV